MTERNDDDTEHEALREGERAEYEWLMARDADASAPAPSEAVARDYQRLEHMLATLPDDPDAAWQEGLLDRIRGTQAVAPIRAARKRPTWWLGLGGGAVAVAVLAVVILLPPSKAQLSPDRLPAELLFSRGGAVRGDADGHHIGDVISTPDRPLSTDLRLYGPDGAMVAHCPDGIGCVRKADQQHLEYVVRTRGRHVFVKTEQAHPDLPKLLDDYLDALQRSHITAYRQDITVE